MRLKQGQKVKVAYMETGVPDYCWYKGPGVFVRYVRKEENEWPDAMCVVEIPKHGACFFPVADVWAAQ